MANPSGAALVLSQYELYLVLVVVGALSAILGFGTHTIPSWVGYTGIAAALVVLFGYLADMFIAASAGEYLVITVAAAIVGEVATLQGVQNATLAIVLVWAVAILAAVYHSVSQNGSQFLNSQQETWAIAITGAGLSFFTFWSNNPTATEAAIIATLITTIGQFVRASVSVAPPSSSKPAVPPAPVV
jgi:hypothetical protein